MTTPARVSGPGALSQRTDNGQPLRHMANAKYGEDKAFIAQQKAAPLADGPDRPSPVAVQPGGMSGMGGPSAGGGQVAGPPPELTPLSAPTTRPGEPVTSGAALGPGPGPAGPPKPQVSAGQLSSALAPYFAADNTGVLREFAWKLSEMGL